MTISYATHDEVMISNFINDPDYADFYLSEVLKDGSNHEIQRVRYWYDEAKSRANYWQKTQDTALAL